MMAAAPLLTIVIDGVPVIGVIRKRTRRVIVVELVAPFGGLSLSTTVPLLGAGRVDLRQEEGHLAAESLLHTLNRVAHHLDEHRAELWARWCDVSAQLDVINEHDVDRPEVLRAARKELRQRYLTGGLTQTAYQSERRGLARRGARFEQRRRTLLDSFSDEALWGTGLRLEEAIAFIRPNRRR